MNILKLKSTLFSLMAITMLTALMTSCEKEPITPTEETLMVEEKTPPVTTNLSEDVNLRSFNKPCFVKLCYSSYLKRCGEQAGINYWLGVLGNAYFPSPDKITDVAMGFITSQEASNKWENNYASYLAARGLNRSHISKRIYIAYRGLLLRQPDVSGGIYWTNIQRSEGLRAAVFNIGSSQEFRNRLNNIQAECNAYNANCN